MDLKRLDAGKHEEFIYLTTIGRKTGKSHTVELWFALAEGKIYLSHEGKYTDWMKNITKNEQVDVRIGSLNLKANAKVAKEAAARESGKRALYEKYYGKAAKGIIGDWFELSIVLELTPLQAS